MVQCCEGLRCIAWIPRRGTRDHKGFPVFQEDLRTKIVGYEVVEVRQSSRQTGAPPPMRIEVADAEIMLLKERVMYDLNSVTKARSRPRKSPTI